MRRLFIHLPPFERRWKEVGLFDDDLRLLQVFILQNSTAGDVVQGTHGIRKIRWFRDGKGKRGGLRVFYLDIPEYSRTYLITMLRKSDIGDLTQEERNSLGMMVLELKQVLHDKKKSK